VEGEKKKNPGGKKKSKTEKGNIRSWKRKKARGKRDVRHEKRGNSDEKFQIQSAGGGGRVTRVCPVRMRETHTGEEKETNTSKIGKGETIDQRLENYGKVARSRKGQPLVGGGLKKYGGGKSHEGQQNFEKKIQDRTAKNGGERGRKKRRLLKDEFIPLTLRE